MTHARQAQSATLPTSTIILGTALAAALTVGIAIGTALDVGGLDVPTITYAPPHPLLLEAERRWEVERQQQSGGFDIVTPAEREWENQRKQQSGDFR